jgi:hypothetical protein
MSRYFVMSSRTPEGDARAGTPTGVESSPPLDERAQRLKTYCLTLRQVHLLPPLQIFRCKATPMSTSSGRPLRVRADPEASHLLSCGHVHDFCGALPPVALWFLKIEIWWFLSCRSCSAVVLVMQILKIEI